MNFAEGKGPKQVKRTWPTGTFITLYQNGTISGYATTTPPYPTLSPYGTVSGSVPGSLSPGLCPVSGTNGSIDVGFICSLDSNVGVQDAQSLNIVVTAESGFQGPSTVYVQGTGVRYYQNTTFPSYDWITLTTATVSSGNATVTIFSGQGFPAYNAYRLVASGGTGVIDWSITGMFIDLSAQGVGNNATDVNGSLGQLNIANPRINALVSGSGMTTTPGPSVLANPAANSTYIGG